MAGSASHASSAGCASQGLCRDTECWNAHINDGKGRQVSDKIEFKISEDQGKRKEIAGRAREQMEEG